MAKTNIVDWKTITNFVVDAFVGYGIPPCRRRNLCGYPAGIRQERH